MPERRWLIDLSYFSAVPKVKTIASLLRAYRLFYLSLVHVATRHVGCDKRYMYIGGRSMDVNLFECGISQWSTIFLL